MNQFPAPSKNVATGRIGTGFNKKHRQHQARKIIAAPEFYQVCYGCDSILSRKAVTCPLCHAYRFDISLKAVTRKAGELASAKESNFFQ